MAVKEVYAGTTKEWRSWLKKNHKKEKTVKLIVYKNHTGKPYMTHNQAMCEAICFGWIDTTIKKLDEDRFIRTFVRRTEKSKWGKNTLKYARELIKKKKMSVFGLKMYKLGKKLFLHMIKTYQRRLKRLWF